MSSPNLPTFSALARAFACPLSCCLPHADHSSEDARAGTARHAFLQRIAELVQGGQGRPAVPLEEARGIALDEAEEVDRAYLAALPVEQLQLASIAPEVTLAYDVATGKARELGRNLGRNYEGVWPTEFVGTTDRLGLKGDDAIYIGDYKGRSHRIPVSEDPQLLAAALCATRIHQRERAELEVVKLIDGEPFHSSATVEAFDLDGFEFRLQDLAARIEKDRAAYKTGDIPDARTGPHCHYCSSLAYCPAKMALARAVLGGDSDEMLNIREVGAAYITPDNAPRLYELTREADKLLQAVKEALVDFARVTPIHLPDGRVYGVPPDAEQKEITDSRRAEKALSELFGLEAAEKGAVIELSATGVERAVKAWLATQPTTVNRRGAIKEWKEKAEALLKERGLLRVIRGGQVRAFKPAKEIGDAA